MKRKLKKQAIQQKKTSDDKIVRADTLLKEAERLYTQKHYKEALNLYLDVVLFIPQHFYAFYRIGSCFQELNLLNEAYKAFKKSLEICQKFYPARVSLIEILWSVGDKTDAIALGLEAMQLFPQVGDFGVLFARLMMAGVSQDHRLFYMKKMALQSLKTSPDLMSKFILMRLQPKGFPETAAEENQEKNRIYRYMKMIRDKGNTYDLPDQHHLTFFPAAYNYIGTRQFFEDVSHFLRQVFPVLNVVTNNAISSPDKKIRLAVYSSHFNKTHAVHFCFSLLIAKLNRKNFTVIQIDPATLQTTVPADAPLLCPVDEYYFVESIAEAKTKLASLNLDVILYLDPCMSSWGYYLIHMRLAPIQCVMLGHPTTFGVNTLDYYISSEDIEAEDAQKYYTEKLVKLKGNPSVYKKPVLQKSYTPENFGLPTNKNIYLCSQTAYKIQYGMDEVFQQILKKDPNGILVFIKTDAFDYVEMRWEKFHVFQGVDDRVIRLNTLLFQDFLGLVSIATVFLDTFPFGGGNTCFQSFAFGVPIVAYNCPEAKGRSSRLFYKKAGLEHLICNTKEDYVNLAVRFATDRDFRQEISDQMFKSHGKIFEDNTIVGEFERFLEKVVAEKRNETRQESAA